MDIRHKLHISKQIALIIAGAVGFLMLFGGLLLAGLPQPKSKPTGGEIQEIILQNDQAKLRIQRNGVVEISTKDRTVFQFWDQDRVNKLFSLLEQTDWSKFNSRLKPGERGYLLTLVTANGTITVAIPEGLDLPPVVEELVTLFEELVEQAGGGSPSPSQSLPPFFSPTPTPRPSTSNPSPSPTPKPSSSSPTPTPTPIPSGGGYGGGSPTEPFVCTYTGTTSKRMLLSETQCDLVE